ncbi:uncharacterized protein LOC142343101 [Convolutriloba macropyga]|uniref:uncharacterized protein LOC142343101 n=1 Tax=Convolutriloba macropyga TaxID=536237 RepID=UPI003F51CD88
MDYDYYGLSEEESGMMCRVMRMTEFLMFPTMVSSQIFCFVLSTLATIALAKIYNKHSNSSLTFVLLMASACTLLVAVEVSVSGYLLVKLNYNDTHRWVALLLVV